MGNFGCHPERLYVFCPSRNSPKVTQLTY